jgi:catechol 2,3-dioxygenase-like lactoylglutathione lyase family enzyme
MKRTIILTLVLSTAFIAAPAGAQLTEEPHFHHAHLNVVDIDASIAYYEKIFGAPRIKFRDIADAVLTDRSFFLFNKVDKPAPWEMISGIYHLGWGGVNGPSEFEWRDKLGVEWQTGLNSLGENYYMYAYGPDKEVVEVWTGFRHNRFGHVHLFSDDVKAATEWYVENLGVKGPARIAPKPPKAPAEFSNGLATNPGGVFRYLWTSAVSTNNGVTINIFAKPSDDTVNWWSDPPVGDLVASDGRVVDHLAFSYRDIEPVFEHMKKNGVEIVKPIRHDESLNMKSFFVRGPDKVLIEIVEARPLPGGVWESKD